MIDDVEAGSEVRILDKRIGGKYANQANILEHQSGAFANDPDNSPDATGKKHI